MISMLAPDDEESYGHAIELLIQKFDTYISPYVRESYLNGNSFDLGGHCAGRAGECASTQGMERRGGVIKDVHDHIMKSYGSPKLESRNPLHLLAAVARDYKYNCSHDKFSSSPKRERVAYAYDQLRDMSKHKVVTSTTTSRKRQNFPSTFLYAFCLVGPSKEESPLHNVLGKSDTSFQLVIPTASRTFTSLSVLLQEDLSNISGGPLELQPYSHGSSQTEDLSDLNTLNPLLTGLSPDKQKQLKTAIRERMLADTPAPLPGEGLVAYLLRRAHRHPALDALDTSHADEIDQLKKAKKAKRSYKKNSNSKKASKKQTFKQQLSEQLAKEKNCCGDEAAAVASSTVSVPETTVNTTSNSWGDVGESMLSQEVLQEEFFNIDECEVGEGGEEEDCLDIVFNEAAMEEEAAAIDDLNNRVRVKNELGDFMYYSEGM